MPPYQITKPDYRLPVVGAVLVVGGLGIAGLIDYIRPDVPPPTVDTVVVTATPIPYGGRLTPEQQKVLDAYLTDQEKPGFDPNDPKYATLPLPDGNHSVTIESAIAHPLK
ncbi:hypothetical protein HZB01_02470 [Candidatus Woesearchaeota archaeon]|nr:hypothetical protein [Candidatus Woesearchaeota archaeon]